MPGTYTTCVTLMKYHYILISIVVVCGAVALYTVRSLFVPQRIAPNDQVTNVLPVPETATTTESVPTKQSNKETKKSFEKTSDDLLKERLTSLQYYVTQEEGTEQPYDNAYWKNYEEGIYVDIVSGEALFSSLDKYDSETGWPSFTKPISAQAVTYHEDVDLGFTRVEVRSAQADSHLGHVFDDGPSDRGGQRFCMNSAALRFIPRKDLTKEGYGAYEALFTIK